MTSRKKKSMGRGTSRSDATGGEDEGRRRGKHSGTLGICYERKSHTLGEKGGRDERERQRLDVRKNS